MALAVMAFQELVGFAVDTATGEQGFVQRMTNGTGSASVRGSVVCCDTTDDGKFILQTNEFDSIGVVAEDGIADDAATWVWMIGSICEVLFKDSESATRGYVALAADTDGRAYNIAVPTSTPGQDTHWKEIGT